MTSSKIVQLFEGGGHDKGAYEDCLLANLRVVLLWRRHIEIHQGNIEQNEGGGVEAIHWVELFGDIVDDALHVGGGNL